MNSRPLFRLFSQHIENKMFVVAESYKIHQPVRLIQCFKLRNGVLLLDELMSQNIGAGIKSQESAQKIC